MPPLIINEEEIDMATERSVAHWMTRGRLSVGAPDIGEVAVIGLGAMGAPMAAHLTSSGVQVLGVDSDPRAGDRFAGAVHPDRADLSGAGAIVTMLPEGDSRQTGL